MIDATDQILASFVQDLGHTVETSAGKLGGKATLPGTRFPVSLLLAELANNRSMEEIVENYDLSLSAVSSFLFRLASLLERPAVGQGVYRCPSCPGLFAGEDLGAKAVPGNPPRVGCRCPSCVKVFELEALVEDMREQLAEAKAALESRIMDEYSG